MSEKDSLIGNLVNGIKEHSKAFGITGAAIGVLLVICYCGSIKFYPSGLSLADTLFFFWAVIVFGFYYSVIAFAFFVSSIFWVAAFTKPINYLLNLKNSKKNFVVNFPENDFIVVIGTGLLANVLILGSTYFSGHSLLRTFVAILFVGFIYALIDNVSKTPNVSSKIVDAKGNQIHTNPINPLVVRSIFYLLIYVIPLLFAQVGGGVTRSTFETMGVRKLNVDVSIDAVGYKTTLESYKSRDLTPDFSCSDECLIEGVTVLFTGIGTSTKILMSGKKGEVEIVLPSKSIRAIATKKTNNSINAQP